MTISIHDDLTARDVINNPHPYFHLLRKEDPVHWNNAWEGWILTKYEDVAQAFQDARLSAERMKPNKKMPEQKAQEMKSTYQLLSKWMTFNDPPKHTRLRMLANKAFTPKAVNKLNPRIYEISNELLDGIQGRNQVDLIKDYAYTLPILVISEMLGLPREDRDLIKKWSDVLMLFIFGAINVKDRHERARKNLGDMAAYLGDIVEERRRNPKDDLISTIAIAADGDDHLTTEEIVSTCTLLVFGGHETTTNLIANGTFSLLDNEEQFQKLKQAPEMMPSAIEEFLRYEGPSKAMIRIAKEDLEISGKQINRGQRLLLVQAAANRDPDVFQDPNQLDIGRKPNPHLGFGRGIHYCLGGSLARLEGSIAIGELIKRFPDMALQTEKLEWQPTIINRGLKNLPIFLNKG